MAYVYRHIRLDKNEPFYIGIGSDDKGQYKRAYDNGLRSRNKFWNNIVAITKYDIEILLDDIAWEDACKKEIEFIALYKRRKDGGTLANLTLGGEGQLGMCGELNGMFGRKASEETRLKQSIVKKGKPTKNKGKPMPAHVKEKIILANTGKPSWNKGIAPSSETIAKQMKTKKERGVILSGENHPRFGKTHSDELKKRWSISRKGAIPWNKGKSGYPVISGQDHRKKVVLQFDLMENLVKEYSSLAEAAKETGFRKGSICKAILGLDRMKTHKGYIWKYKGEEI